MQFLQILAQNSGNGGAAAGMSIGFVLIVGLLGLLAFGFWIWMLIDAISNLPSGTEKIIWVLVIVFTGFIGALIYFFVGRKSARV